MLIHILGSAAGGGFPQWNCNCKNCSEVRKNNPNFKARTQSSIAVSSDGVEWVLFNASPDILTQIQQFKSIQPARYLRDTGINSIILMDAQIDHTTGLFMLRENNKPLNIYCTKMVYDDLTTGNPIFKILKHYSDVNWNEIDVSSESKAFTILNENILFTPIPLKSKAPPYSPHRNDPHVGDNIGMLITDNSTNKSVFYAPGLGDIDEGVIEVMKQANCLLVDGTCWTNEEMITQKLGTKKALEMGHLPQTGDSGMIKILETMPDQTRKILIHINNSNPILDDSSEERKQLTDNNIEVAFDGMQITI
jgi:pyrroloquinoline quinone biosynthesis protein B